MAILLRHEVPKDIKLEYFKICQLIQILESIKGYWSFRDKDYTQWIHSWPKYRKAQHFLPLLCTSEILLKEITKPIYK